MAIVSDYLAQMVCILEFVEVNRCRVVLDFAPPALEINYGPPPQIFGLVGPLKKRVNRDKLNPVQKVRILCFVI